MHTSFSQSPPSMALDAFSKHSSHHRIDVDVDDLDDLDDLDLDLRCGYAGKRCPNFRTDKKGGGLHRFCEVHRLRANKNQWLVDNKRRAVRSLRRQLLKRSNAVVNALPLPDPVDIASDSAALTLDDVVMLQTILFGKEASYLLPFPQPPRSEQDTHCSAAWRGGIFSV